MRFGDLRCRDESGWRMLIADARGSLLTEEMSRIVIVNKSASSEESFLDLRKEL